MINKSNLGALLSYLKFVKSGDVYIKHYVDYGCDMSADLKNEELSYPSAIEGRERNTSFSSPENFVVFECVDRLLTKGYRPEHIELEKEWHLGHDAKGGRADICVYNEDHSEMLFIVECKTYGQKYKKAYDEMLIDGGQLFSYWQQENAAKWLALYASDFNGKERVENCQVVNCVDDPNIVQVAKKDTSVHLYKDAHTALEKYKVWNETYNLQMYENLIFDKDTVAYKIGIKPLYKKDLKDFRPDDKIVNRFEEILRHNNISDKENAFNRLIVLFICKLVDEISKTDHDIVDFQYKQGTDTYESLQDRLQRLHQKGMKEFMKEDIFYVSNDYAENLFRTYTGKQRKQAIDDLNRIIRILKFYSNNDFAFKDVHNEELFYQNGKILVEVVQLFEKYKIVYPSKHQFLGDLFEQLLNKGFKQNEGQFFTPIPITRFIWDSLPLKMLMKKEDSYQFPKIIDYACGAGHFLTEAIESVNEICRGFGEQVDNSWIEKYIFGIEKDYRLARVSKVSMFMNGAGAANIVFGDGLENYPEKNILPGTFDILVANPPYSVSAFKTHLSLKNNEFELTNRITNNGSEIECLFVERISQLVRPGGVAAVILPSSILSNNSGSYIGAREQVLKHFYVRAITCFGSKTFGETGTNTVVLFLEKMEGIPVRHKLVEDSADAILRGEDLSDWEDVEIYEKYLEQIEVDQDIFGEFIQEIREYTEYRDIDYFADYFEAFIISSTVKAKQKQKKFVESSEAERYAWLNTEFYKYVKNCEREKIIYFSLVYKQKVLVITSPADNVKQKVFLGYDWSKRKGSEGIIVKNLGGLLYDDKDRESMETLASLIRSSFHSEYRDIAGKEEFYHYAYLKDMIDFKRIPFNKEIKTSVSKNLEVTSIYPLIRIQEGCTVINPSKKELTEISDDTIVSFVEMESVNPAGFIDNKVNRKLGELRGGYTYFREGDIIIAKITPCMENGKCALAENLTNGIGMGSSEFHVFRAGNGIKKEYLFAYLNRDCVRSLAEANMTGASGHRRVPIEFYQNMLIPIPPMEVQDAIIEECAFVDKIFVEKRDDIKQKRVKINELFVELKNMPGGRNIGLNDPVFQITIGKRVLKSQITGDGGIPVYSANVNEPFGNIKGSFFSDFSIGTALWGIDGDWMTGYIKPEREFYPTDHCGTIRTISPDINVHYVAMALEEVGRAENFSRTYRASTERVMALKLYIPPVEKQESYMQQIEALQENIADIEAELKTVEVKKNLILERYLNDIL